MRGILAGRRVHHRRVSADDERAQLVGRLCHFGLLLIGQGRERQGELGACGERSRHFHARSGDLADVRALLVAAARLVRLGQVHRHAHDVGHSVAHREDDAGVHALGGRVAAVVLQQRNDVALHAERLAGVGVEERASVKCLAVPILRILRIDGHDARTVVDRVHGVTQKGIVGGRAARIHDSLVDMPDDDAARFVIVLRLVFMAFGAVRGRQSPVEALVLAVLHQIVLAFGAGGDAQAPVALVAPERGDVVRAVGGYLDGLYVAELFQAEGVEADGDEDSFAAIGNVVAPRSACHQADFSYVVGQPGKLVDGRIGIIRGVVDIVQVGQSQVMSQFVRDGARGHGLSGDDVVRKDFSHGDVVVDHDFAVRDGVDDRCGCEAVLVHAGQLPSAGPG